MQGMKSGLLLLLPPLTLTDNQWSIILPGSSMRFQSLIMVSSCRTKAGDQQMTVSLGQINSNRFHDVGEDSNPTPLAIHLQDCSTAISQHVGVAFHGIADSEGPDMLSVGGDPGIASGIGIALLDSQGRQLPLSRPSGRWVSLYRRPTALNFVAKYRTTGHQVTGGAASTQTWFSLTYQ